MAFDVNAFKQNIGNYGTLQNNKFEVSIPVNAALGKISTMGSSDLAKLMTFRACDTALPGLKIQTGDNLIYGIGPAQKMPYNITYTDSTISFISDANGEIYNFFYGWLNYIIQFSTINNGGIPSFQLAYKDNYTTSITIKTFENEGNPVMTHTLNKAFPTYLEEIPLSWENGSNLMKVTVGISYFTWSLQLT